MPILSPSGGVTPRKWASRASAVQEFLNFLWSNFDLVSFDWRRENHEWKGFSFSSLLNSHLRVCEFRLHPLPLIVIPIIKWSLWFHLNGHVWFLSKGHCDSFERLLSGHFLHVSCISRPIGVSWSLPFLAFSSSSHRFQRSPCVCVLEHEYPRQWQCNAAKLFSR